MATKTIPQLPAATSVVAGTLFAIVDDPAGTPVTQKATGTQLDAYIRGAGGALTATTLDGSGGALTINTAQADKDVVVSSTGMVNLLFTDAGNNRVGINTATPTVALQVVGTVTATLFSGDGSALTSLPATGTGLLLTVAGNPATPVLANCWYNSSTNAFRGYAAPYGTVWSTSGAYPINTIGSGGGGTSSSAFSAGGMDDSYSPTWDTPYGTNCYSFNGSTWSATTSMSARRHGPLSAGTTTATIAACGFDLRNEATQTDAELWNGTAWSSTSAPAVAIYAGCCGGTSTAFFSAGGQSPRISPTVYDTTNLFNGSTWSTSGTLIGGRCRGGAAGTATAGLVWCGCEPLYRQAIRTTEKFNGTTWASANSMVTDLSRCSGCGTQSAAVQVGSNETAVTYNYDGTTWTTGVNAGTPTGINGVSANAAGTQSDAVAWGNLITKKLTVGFISQTLTFTTA